MNIQKLVRNYYTRWEKIGQYEVPNLTDCLDFMMTEVTEAIDLRLRRGRVYVRNNPREERVTSEDIAIEVFDAIMMGCVALDLLGLDLEDIAQKKLEYMDRKRRQ